MNWKCTGMYIGNMENGVIAMQFRKMHMKAG